MGVLELCEGVHLADVVSTQNPFLIDRDMPAATAIDTFCKTKYSAAPIMGARGELYGWLDYSLLCKILISDSRIAYDTTTFAKLTSSMTAKDLCDRFGANPIYALLPESNILQAVSVMSGGIHRIAVCDLAGHFKGVYAFLELRAETLC